MAEADPGNEILFLKNIWSCGLIRLSFFGRMIFEKLMSFLLDKCVGKTIQFFIYIVAFLKKLSFFFVDFHNDFQIQKASKNL